MDAALLDPPDTDLDLVAALVADPTLTEAEARRLFALPPAPLTREEREELRELALADLAAEAQEWGFYG